MSLKYFAISVHSYLLLNINISKMNNTTKFTNSKNNLKLSRRGRKLSILDDSKVITNLPKEIPERTWSEILQKEENDLVIFDIREEIVENALKIGYYHYMEKQNIKFTVHCAIKAWLQIIDWYFYRHDPGEDVSASPACFIPKRDESWQPDVPPEPSPKDSWCQQRLVVLEDESKESLRGGPSSTSLDYPVVEEIPRECWFPGRVNLKIESDTEGNSDIDDSEEYDTSGTSPARTSEATLAAESEVLQKVTDYSTEAMVKEAASSKVISEKKLSRIARSSGISGSGDASAKSSRPLIRQPPSSLSGRSRLTALPPLPLERRSRISMISDCRLRSLRMDTQYEVSSEKINQSPTENSKRKQGR